MISALTVLSILLFLLVDWLIKVYVFKRISNLPLNYRNILGILALVSLSYLVNWRLGFYLEPFYLLFVVVFVLKPNWQRSQIIYYSFMPFVIVDLFQKVSGSYLVKYLIISEKDFDATLYFFAMHGLFLFLPIYFIFVRVMTIDFRSINRMFFQQHYRKVILFLNGSLLTYTLLLYPILVYSAKNQEATIALAFGSFEATLDILQTYLLVFVGGLIYLNYQSKELLYQELQTAKDKQLKALSVYSQHVESLYKELRYFRHDYTNVLISLNEALQQDDITMAKQVYESVMADSDKSFYDSRYDIAKLINLQNPSLKSVLSAKLMEAQSLGINLSVEIESPIDVPDMDLLEFIQLLSIFLDNAIEASVKAKNPSLLLAYFQKEEEKVLIVANSTLEIQVNTTAIFREGFSSKGSNRGIGLANVKTILAKYPNASLSTQSDQYRFTQTLVIRS